MKSSTSNILVFYNNDPLSQDAGGGAAYIRELYRYIKKNRISSFHFFCASRYLRRSSGDSNISYISFTYRFSLYFISLSIWYFLFGKKMAKNSTVIFHRNYAAWPHYIVSPSNSKVIITCHGKTGYGLQHSALPFRSKLQKFIRFLEKKAFSRAHKVIFVSHTDRDYYVNKMRYITPSKAYVLPAPLSPLFTRASEQIPKEYATKLIIVSRIEQIKNIQLAIKTVHLLKTFHNREYHLSIYGDGSDLEHLKNLTRNLHLSKNITFAGTIKHTQVPGVIAQNGIFLMTSVSEASPTVVKEALALGRCVASMNVGDVAQWIEEGRNGHICKSFNPSDYASVIMQCSDLITESTYKYSTKIHECYPASVFSKAYDIYCS